MFVETKEAGEVIEAPAKTLKLSEAIRAGCQRSAPTKEIAVTAWVTWRGQRCFSCVIGAAWLGATNGNQTKWMHSGAMRDQFATLFGLSHDILQRASMLYEYEGCSREQIADWLEAQGY